MHRTGIALRLSRLKTHSLALAVYSSVFVFLMALNLVAEQDPHELTEEETDDILTMLPQIFERMGWNMREMTAALCAQIGKRFKRGSGRKFTEKMYRVFKAKWLDDPHAVENWIQMAAEQDIVLEL
jgi:hypothetical protein